MAGDIAHLKNWRFHIDLEGIAWAIIDVERPVAEHARPRRHRGDGRILTAVADGVRDKSIRGLVVMSGKDNSFIAGADIKEFDDLTTEAEVVGGSPRKSPRSSTAWSACRFRSSPRSTATVSAAGSNSRSPVITASATARKARASACPR